MTFRTMVLGIFLICSLITLARGQGVYEAWVRRYNGPANSSDQAVALAVDDSGNVYVTGFSNDTVTFSDYATIKYSPSGDTLWVRRYNGPENGLDAPAALKVDNTGNVYVTGYSADTGSFPSSLDYATIKYSPNGGTLWVRRYNGPGNSWDQTTALAVDNSGYVYVTGYSADTGALYSSLDYATIKYSPAGDTLWVRRYNGPGNDEDQTTALTIDDSGNVYVTGFSTGSFFGYTDYATLKYSPAGNLLWVKRYNGPLSADDQARALAVDGNRNVYVTGWSHGLGNFIDYLTIKYNPNGDTSWTRRYTGPAPIGFDIPNALAVDVNGNVYVTGQSPDSGGSNLEYATVKYAPNGNLLWARRYNRPSTTFFNDDLAYSLKVDGSGNTYVTGLSQDEVTFGDYATIKYAPNGDTLWLRRYAGERDSSDEGATALESDGSGNVYVTGYSYSFGSITIFSDYLTIKYSPCSAIPGDVNGTPPINLPDIIHLVNYVFDKDRPATSCLGADPGNCWTPDPLCQGEVNGTPPIGLPDIIHLVNFVFDKDKPAESCLGTDPGNCWTPVATEACCLPVP